MDLARMDHYAPLSHRYRCNTRASLIASFRLHAAWGQNVFERLRLQFRERASQTGELDEETGAFCRDEFSFSRYVQRADATRTVPEAVLLHAREELRPEFLGIAAWTIDAGLSHLVDHGPGGSGIGSRSDAGRDRRDQSRHGGEAYEANFVHFISP
ncbi:hypothetical protein [Ensifer adhaerens]|uniref:hypothetical protein n=1 Tax=Ensifer adhaerens TaxID=106592 RepID=UPI00399B50F1